MRPSLFLSVGFCIFLLRAVIVPRHACTVHLVKYKKDITKDFILISYHSYILLYLISYILYSPQKMKRIRKTVNGCMRERFGDCQGTSRFGSAFCSGIDGTVITYGSWIVGMRGSSRYYLLIMKY